MKIALSGGGSAGHVTPTLAVADALRVLRPNIQMRYLGQAHGMEKRIVEAHGLQFAPIRAGKFRRDHFAKSYKKIINISTLGPNIRDGARMVAGVADAVRALRQFRPEVVFISGGYVGVPVGIAAKMLQIPYIIHESDVEPGLANKLLSRWAHKIAVGFPVKSYTAFDPQKLVFVGNPVRQEILRAHRLDGLAAFKLDETLPVVLITGGSQGSAQMNDAIIEILEPLLEICQVIHLTGEGEYSRLQFKLRGRKMVKHFERYRTYAFLLDDMAAALAVADVVVARAGAGTIAELAMLAKPAILVPNTQMAGHQVANARVVSRAGAGWVIDGSHFSSQNLLTQLQSLLNDTRAQLSLGKALHTFATPDAAERLARLVIDAGDSRPAQSPHSDGEATLG